MHAQPRKPSRPCVSGTTDKIGIIAGGGELPLEIARACRKAGKDVFVFAVAEFAGDFPAIFEQDRASIAKLGRCLKVLKQQQCRELVFAGNIARPKDRRISIRPDFAAVVFLLTNFGVLTRSNDGIHRAFAGFFERRGFKVVSPLTAAPTLAAQAGNLTKNVPRPEVESQFREALVEARRHGATGQGQAIIYGDNKVIATEQRAGTDSMLRNLTTAPNECHFLVKAMSPEQLSTMDPPAIGVDTVRLAAERGLSGILVEANRSIVVNPEQVREVADQAGIFVCGVTVEP